MPAQYGDDYIYIRLQIPRNEQRSATRCTFTHPACILVHYGHPVIHIDFPNSIRLYNYLKLSVNTHYTAIQLSVAQLISGSRRIAAAEYDPVVALQSLQAAVPDFEMAAALDVQPVGKLAASRLLPCFEA